MMDPSMSSLPPMEEDAIAPLSGPVEASEGSQVNRRKQGSEGDDRHDQLQQQDVMESEKDMQPSELDLFQANNTAGAPSIDAQILASDASEVKKQQQHEMIQSDAKVDRLESAVTQEELITLNIQSGETPWAVSPSGDSQGEGTYLNRKDYGDDPKNPPIPPAWSGV